MPETNKGTSFFSQKTMKLYEIPKGSKIHCDCSDGSSFVIFNNLDGAFSHCTTEKGGTAHIGASAELVAHKDGFSFPQEQ